MESNGEFSDRGTRKVGNSMTYEKLKKINENLRTIDIERKDKSGKVIVKKYSMVVDRVDGFRQIFPLGSITTEILTMDESSVVMKAIVSDEDGRVLATGLAREERDSSFINKTSYIENCETSAVGRALGFLGIGIDESMASADEVANAITQQNAEPRKATDKQIAFIKKNADYETLEALFSEYGSNFDSLTIDVASEVIGKLKNNG